MKPRRLHQLAGAASAVALSYGAATFAVPAESIAVTTVGENPSARPEGTALPQDAENELQRSMNKGIIILSAGVLAVLGTVAALRHQATEQSSTMQNSQS